MFSFHTFHVITALSDSVTLLQKSQVLRHFLNEVERASSYESNSYLRALQGGRGFETRCGKILNLPNPYSTSNRNEYRKHKKKCFWGVKCGRRIELTTLPPPISRLSRHCGILNISEPYRPPRPVRGVALLFLFLRARYIATKCYLTDRKPRAYEQCKNC
jgi:hypothetical protein